MMTEFMVQDIPMAEIHADQEFNCRGQIIPLDVVDLAKDIESNGLIQPVVIAPYSVEDAAKFGFKYRLVAGYRRHTAHKVLKKTTISSIVRPDMMDEVKARFFNLSENLQRKDLNILQEARAITRLFQLGINEFVAAEQLHMSRGWVQVRFMLLRLPEPVQQEVAVGMINQTQVRELYTVYKDKGELECIKKAKEIKEAKEKGKVISVDPNKAKPEQKRQRKRPEMFDMMAMIQESMGNNIGTRCLAWACGEISNGELFESLKVEAERQGKIFVIPTEEI